MEVKQRRGRKKALSQQDRFLELSGTFGAFGRLFKTTAGKSMQQIVDRAERDEVMAKVCTGLSEVCKMLAESSTKR